VNRVICDWENGNAVRRRWRKNTAGRYRLPLDGHAATDRVQRVSEVGLDWTPLYIPTYLNGMNAVPTCVEHYET
jgi:hypothetical protein